MKSFLPLGGNVHRLIAVAALMALAALALACGQEEEALPQASETPAASSSPSPASVTPTVEATQAPLATAEPGPPAGGKAPDGCLLTEKAYVDPNGRFAFCYPGDMELVIVDSGDGPAPTVRHPILDENRVVITFGWQPTLHSVTGEPCVLSMDVKQNEVVREFSVGSKTGKACFADHFESDDSGNPTTLKHKTIDIELPIDEGFIGIHVTVTGPAWTREGKPVEAIASRVLDSAVIY